VTRTRLTRTRVTRTRLARTRLARTRVTRTRVTRTRVVRARAARTRKPSITGRPRSTAIPGTTCKPVSPGHPVSSRAVCLRTRVCARRRTAGRLRPERTPPVGAERILAWAQPGTSLIPGRTHSARGAGRRRTVRAIRTVGARRDPAPVRQPVLAAGHRSAVRRTPVHRAPVRGARGHGTAVARRAVRRVAVGGVPGRRRETARRRAHACAPRLVEARLGRRFSGPPQQVAVFVVGTVRPVRARAVVRPVGAAIAQASSPGQAISIATQAGVATFHQVPPGLDLVSSRAAGHALPDECRSGEIPCRT
jgi:hypothetical protein